MSCVMIPVPYYDDAGNLGTFLLCDMIDCFCEKSKQSYNFVPHVDIASKASTVSQQSRGSAG